MKRLIALLFGISLTSMCMYCNVMPPPKTPAEIKRALVEDLELKTVALLKPLEDGTLMPYCTGVWVGEDKILTAGHCVTEEMIVYGVKDDEDEAIGRVSYVVDVEEDLDLALLVSDPRSTPKHPTAVLADDVWDGQHVNIVGHTTGLWWSYMEGVVSSTRSNITNGGKKLPKSLQISSPAWFGNSGGGAFDDDGRLLGISSWISRRAPLMSFFIHRGEIARFLSKNYSGQKRIYDDE